MNGKLAFCFPGQGSQDVGMGRAFAEAFPEARAIFEEASDEVGYDVGRICFEGPIEDLTRTEVQQPALVATSVACLRAV
jgi:[acyl-carrier-protein] S-malonyltransferase